MYRDYKQIRCKESNRDSKRYKGCFIKSRAERGNNYMLIFYVMSTENVVFADQNEAASLSENKYL